MRKCFFFILVLMVIRNTDSMAQLSQPSQYPGLNQWFPGWYITLEGDTTRGFIFLSNQIDNQSTFKFSKDNPPGINIEIMKPAKVKGFLVRDRVYESMEKVFDKDSPPVFVRRMETGGLSLYTWYRIPTNGIMRDGRSDRPITASDEKFHETSYLLRMKNETPFVVPPPKDFAKVMSKVVEDDEALSQKILQELNGFRSADILNIVQQYNEWFTTNR